MRILTCLAVTWAAAQAETAEYPDIGWNLLFESASEEFQDHCVQLPAAFSSWAEGDFVISSTGLYEMGDRRFTGVLDAFGKIHRFSMKGKEVCATYRILRSGFYNESRKKGTVSDGMLFYDTTPARPPCPLWYPLCHADAPNDNTFVNSIRVNKQLLTLTDSPHMLVVDPVSMQVMGKKNFEDRLTGMMAFSGSAHPLKHPTTGAWVDFVGNYQALHGTAKLRVFALSEENPDTRVQIIEVDYDSCPYMHSFGLTSGHLVLPKMPMKFDMMASLSKPMSQCFEHIKVNEASQDNGFVIIDLSSGAMRRLSLPVDEPLYYVHTVNAYENDTDIVIDLTTSNQDAFESSLFVVSSIKDKALRDQSPHMVVKRFVVPLSDNDSRPIQSSLLSDPRFSTDFPSINNRLHGKHYCFYWAVEWFQDLKSFASVAIVKHNVCTGGDAIRWHRQFWYPSEATLISSPDANAAEDEGTLVFTALDGVNEVSFLVTIDAQTMQTISEAGPFPRISFTTHGKFYRAGSFEETLVV